MSDPASKAAKDEISAEAQRRADDAALKVNEDAKQFAANLRSEILTRVHRNPPRSTRCSTRTRCDDVVG